MSYMLKALLSKTLQTFLYKYLEDVDVEGVAMPSLMDADGQSGWGVRLCNVKLREGVELMTLPGKRIVKRKRRRRKVASSKSNEDDGDASATGANDKQATAEQDENDVAPVETLVDINGAATSRDMPALDTAKFENGTDFKDDDLVSRARTDTELEAKAFPAAEDLDDDEEEVEEPIVDGEKKTAAGLEKDSDRDDDEEEVEVEEEMVLRLGNGGRIGTLDVRLLGKDLHVVVEDAFLTVIACPKSEEPDDSSRDTAATADTSKTGDGSAKNKKSPKKQTADAQNVGERVMENSAIAKAIASIPHLFLRDCNVRLIVRENPPAAPKEGEAEQPEEDEVRPDDSLVEVLVEMLSVTSGEDILANVRLDEESSSDLESKPAEQQQARDKSKPSLKVLEEADENEYLVKRIRTGKGPEGGISVKIYPPRAQMYRARPRRSTSPRRVPIYYALERWDLDSQRCLFRCSNLDIRARIYLGKKKEIALRNNDYAWYGEEYDEYTIDSMLYGVDYIAPAPPPLPPMQLNRQTSLSQSPKRADTDIYTTDKNGIQSSKMSSAFHKVARGLVPTLCRKNHLPCEHCPYCWENPARPNSYSEHPLDSATPLPGVVLNISLNDPLEINLDRRGLGVLGNLVSLFAKKTDSAGEPSQDETVTVEEEAKDENPVTKKHWSFRKPKKESIKESFPSYMQPETIEFVGLHVAKVVFRLHVMRDDGCCDTNLSFRYWETTLKCITIDLQKHSSKQKHFLDLRFDLGYIFMNEHRGVETIQLLTLGALHSDDVSDSDSVSQASGSSSTLKSKSKPAWPSTASFILHVPVPSSSQEYESREHHGLQMRWCSLNSRSSANVRLGVLALDAQYAIKSEIFTAIDEAKSVILGPPQPPQASLPASDSESQQASQADDKSLMKYRIHMEGGIIGLDPVIRVRLPPSSKFGGERSTENGLSMLTLLKNVEFEYGKRTNKAASNKCLSISQLAKLPESARLSILMCLKDLGPLETALRVRREGNSFLRCRAVNRAIVTHGSRKPKIHKRTKSRALSSNRRQEILTEISRMDDAALEDLWGRRQKSRPRPRLVKKSSAASRK